MFEQFDKTEDAENIKKTASAEYDRLKKFMSQIDGKQYKSDFFNWTDSPSSGNTILLLGEVAAQFIDMGKRDVAKKGIYSVRFGQRPYSAQEQSPGDYVYPEVWEVKADALDRKFVWTIDGKRYLPDDLPNAIANKLAEVYNTFAEAVGLGE
jgi:hypothetical protein